MATKITKGKYLDYASFDGMAWPLPTLELMEHCRQSNDPIRVAAASALGAYHHMVFDTRENRQRIIKELRAIRRKK